MNPRIEKLQAFLKESPNDCFLNHALALEYIKLGNDAEAKGIFEHNLKIDPAYIATYYHLGKLMERAGQTNDAIKTYDAGMEKAKAAGDMHTYNELKGAYDELAF